MKTIVEWFKSLWARLTKPKAVEVKAEVESSLVKPVASAPKRAYNKNKSKTLSELLDNLDYSFDAMRIDYEDMSFLPKREVDGLKKFGVSVMPSFVRQAYEKDIENYTDKVNKEAGLPAILFIADNMGEKHLEDKDGMYPDFFFAIKQKKCPWFVAKKKGTAYQCGFGYRSRERKKIYWVYFFVTIDADGTVNTTHQLHHKPVKTPSGAYTRKQWQMSSWDEDNKDITDKAVCFWVTEHFNFWGERRNMWSTTVKKDGHRAVFYIDPKDTKDYFKNRDKVVTVNGTSKRIIHLVEEHERNYSSGKKVKIREHIRGLSVFSWNNYSCYVTAPEYHLDIRTYTTPSEEIEDDTPYRDQYLDLPQLADRLHNIAGKKANELNHA